MTVRAVIVITTAIVRVMIVPMANVRSAISRVTTVRPMPKAASLGKSGMGRKNAPSVRTISTSSAPMTARSAPTAGIVRIMTARAATIAKVIVLRASAAISATAIHRARNEATATATVRTARNSAPTVTATGNRPSVRTATAIVRRTAASGKKAIRNAISAARNPAANRAALKNRVAVSAMAVAAITAPLKIFRALSSKSRLSRPGFFMRVCGTRN